MHWGRHPLPMDRMTNRCKNITFPQLCLQMVKMCPIVKVASKTIKIWSRYLQHYSQSRWPHSSRPFHDLTGTIPLFHRSTEKCAIGCEWEPLGAFQLVAFWEWPVAKEPGALWIALLGVCGALPLPQSHLATPSISGNVCLICESNTFIDTMLCWHLFHFTV